MANQPTPDGIRKNRVRRKAAREGLTVVARRVKDPRAVGYGQVALVDRAGEKVVREAGCTWESIETYLDSPAIDKFAQLERLLFTSS